MLLNHCMVHLTYLLNIILKRINHYQQLSQVVNVEEVQINHLINHQMKVQSLKL